MKAPGAYRTPGWRLIQYRYYVIFDNPKQNIAITTGIAGDGARL